MHSKRTILITCFITLVLAQAACAAGRAFGGPTSTPAPTNTPIPTDTPIPPTATSTDTPIPPTATVATIPGSKSPVTIGAFNLNILSVDLNDKGFNGFIPANKTADQTVLVLQVHLNSGSLDDLSSLKLWVTDEQGTRTDSGVTLSVKSQNNVIWMFPVPKTSKKFLLFFPSGEAIDLAPLMP